MAFLVELADLAYLDDLAVLTDLADLADMPIFDLEHLTDFFQKLQKAFISAHTIYPITCTFI